MASAFALVTQNQGREVSLHRGLSFCALKVWLHVLDELLGWFNTAKTSPPGCEVLLSWWLAVHPTKTISFISSAVLALWELSNWAAPEQRLTWTFGENTKTWARLTGLWVVSTEWLHVGLRWAACGARRGLELVRSTDMHLTTQPVIRTDFFSLQVAYKPCCKDRLGPNVLTSDLKMVSPCTFPSQLTS